MTLDHGLYSDPVLSRTSSKRGGRTWLPVVLTHLLASVGAACLASLLTVLLYMQPQNSIAPVARISPSMDQSSSASYTNHQGFYVHPRNSPFRSLAMKAGTDKHNFHAAYESYLEPQAPRQRLQKMLEIGLGCNMHYGPGRSATLWRQYLPHADIWFAEFNAACVAKHQKLLDSQSIRTVTGDQSDPATLRTWIQQTGGDFDMIVDDGGHSNHQIYTSFILLFKHALKPGGVYVIEDLSVSRIDRFQAGPQNSNVVMLDVLRDWIEALLTFPTQDDTQKPDIAYKLRYKMPPGIKRIDCTMVTCAIVKCYVDDQSCSYSKYVDGNLA